MFDLVRHIIPKYTNCWFIIYLYSNTVLGQLLQSLCLIPDTLAIDGLWTPLSLNMSISSGSMCVTSLGIFLKLCPCSGPMWDERRERPRVSGPALMQSNNLGPYLDNYSHFWFLSLSSSSLCRQKICNASSHQHYLKSTHQQPSSVKSVLQIVQM